MAENGEDEKNGRKYRESMKANHEKKQKLMSRVYKNTHTHGAEIRAL